MPHNLIHVLFACSNFKHAMLLLRNFTSHVHLTFRDQKGGVSYNCAIAMAVLSSGAFRTSTEESLTTRQQSHGGLFYLSFGTTSLPSKLKLV